MLFYTWFRCVYDLCLFGCCCFFVRLCFVLRLLFWLLSKLRFFRLLCLSVAGSVCVVGSW